MRAPAAPTRRLIPLTEAAEILAVSVKTVRRYVAAGELDAVRLGRRTIRIKAESIDRLIDTHPVDAWRGRSRHTGMRRMLLCRRSGRVWQPPRRRSRCPTTASTRSHSPTATTRSTTPAPPAGAFRTRSTARTSATTPGAHPQSRARRFTTHRSTAAAGAPRTATPGSSRRATGRCNRILSEMPSRDEWPLAR